jgi:hypothetical protein
MTTTRNTSRAKAVVALAAPLVAIASLALVLHATASASALGNGCVGPYQWPIAPFAEPHPVRANFGDPRTRFAGPEGARALLEGGGTFSFHQGVDISARDGAPVYAVSSGTVTRARGGRVTVDCGNGRSFQYWHVDPVAHVGHHTVAGRTLLGFIQPKREHVHLTELEHYRAVNPLTPRHLTPYRDSTTPRVRSIVGARSHDGALFVVSASDMPSMAVPGRWHGFPVTPALVTWRVERAERVVASGVIRDVCRTEPMNGRFWGTFARGTHQNWPIFAGRKLQRVPGVYLFGLRLTPQQIGALGTTSATLTVAASDTAGNRGLRSLSFTLAGLPVLSGS